MADETDGRSGRLRRLQVVHDVGIAQVQTAVDRVPVVALLSHRQANHSCEWVADAHQHSLWVFGRHQAFMHTADDAQLFAVRIAQGQGVEALLLRQRVARFGAAQAHAANAPMQPRAGFDGVFGHHCQMRAHERTQAQMDDAGLQGVTIVDGALYLGRQGVQRGLIQALHAPTNPTNCRLAASGLSANTRAGKGTWRPGLRRCQHRGRVPRRGA